MNLNKVEEVGEERRPLSFLDGDLLGELDQLNLRLHGSPGRTSKGGSPDEEGFGTG